MQVLAFKELPINTSQSAKSGGGGIYTDVEARSPPHVSEARVFHGVCSPLISRQAGQ